MALAASAATVDATIRPHLMARYRERGVDIGSLLNSTEQWMSRSARSIHKSELRSRRLQTIHKYNRVMKSQRLRQENGEEENDGTQFDQQISEEEIRIIELACANVPDGEECNETVELIQKIFEETKGVLVSLSSLYSEECRGGLVGLIDSLINIYDHIEVYKPENVNKFAMAYNDLTESSNICYAHCDLSHAYEELAKIGDYQNWEQYIEIGCRAGGVLIEDMWSELDVINAADSANDNYAIGLAVGRLISLFLDTLL